MQITQSPPKFPSKLHPGKDYEILCLRCKYDKKHVLTFGNSLANSTKRFDGDE